MSRARSARFKVSAILVGFAVAVLLTEIGLRILGFGFGNSPMEPDPVLHHVHPKNYTFRQFHPSGELGGFDTYYDASGRVVASFNPAREPSTPGNCRVALMGDSFTEAGQVPFEESFAGRLKAAGLGACEVRNYGTRSYSPAIYLVQWTEDVRQWKPTHVFLLLFGNDVREDVLYLSTAVMDPKGFPSAIRGPSDGWLFAQLRRIYLARFGRMLYMQVQYAWQHRGEPKWTVGGVVEENPDWPSKSDKLLIELRRRVEAEGTKLVLMVVPSRYKLMGDGTVPINSEFYHTVEKWATQQGFAFLDLQSPFERASRAGVPLFYLQDIHYNSEGNAVTAAAIARAYPELFPQWRAISSDGVRAAFP